MSLQLILGRAGSGKTHYLYERVIQEAMEHPERNYLVIVPEQFTMATQKELVIRHPNGGILNIDVLSFGRLAHRIFEEVGRSYDGVLDDEGKNLILRKIAGDYENQLKVIGSNLKKFGYISEVKSVISEFTQYNIGEARIEELRQAVPQDSMLAYKLEDISIIYKGFYQYLDENYITGEELLGKLSRVVAQSKILEDSVVVFDGFTGFTPVQEGLLGELMKVCSSVCVTVTMEQMDEFYVNMKGQDLFALSQETVENLTMIAKKHGVKVEKSVTFFQQPTYRFSEQKELAFLEEELFRYRRKKYEDAPVAISTHLLRNPSEEARWVASEIKRLIRTEGYRYQDIAVISSSMEEYGTHLKRACEQYEIPVFSDIKRSILLNSFVEYVRSAVAMIEKNYTYETVFRFLKSGFAPMSMHRVDALETYVLARGITGYKRWQEPWLKDSERMSEQQLNYVNASRVKFVECVQELQFILTQSSKTVEDICKGLYEFFVKNKVQRRIELLEEELQEEGRLALAKEYNQIYGTVLDLFDKLVLLLGDEKVSLREFNELLDAGLQEARIGVIPPSLDAVILGDMTRTRMGNVKVLFFVGNNDTHLPGSMNTSGLLSEHDREWFSEKGVRLKPTSKAQMYIQKFYLYLILTKPSQRLYLSMSKTSVQGKSIRPSYLMGELRKLFPNLKVVEEELSLEDTELTVSWGLNYLIEGLRNTELQGSTKWQELYKWYSQHSEWSSQLQDMVNANRYKKSDDALTEKIAKGLYGEVLRNSVTRLEKFASCPYAHFLSYGLGLKERELHEFEAVDLGNIFHEAMELYSEKMKASGQDWTTVDEKIQIQWAEEAVETSVKEYHYDLLFKSERDKYNITRIKRMMKRSVWAVSKQLACGQFNPEGFEVAFGEETNLASTHIMLNDGQKMILRGQIDRVDLHREGDNTYVKILDYKTGSKELSLSELYYGLQLQLFVYLNAAMELESKNSENKNRDNQRIVPAGVLYYKMNDPFVDQDTKHADVDTSILHELTPDGLVNAAANVLEILDNTNLDEQVAGKSYAVPISSDGKGGLKKASKAISEKEFEHIGTFTKQKVKEIGEEIVGGEIRIEPYKSEDRTGCDYCKYQEICGFDTRMPGYEYKKIEGYKKEESLELIEKAIEADHSKNDDIEIDDIKTARIEMTRVEIEKEGGV